MDLNKPFSKEATAMDEAARIATKRASDEAFKVRRWLLYMSKDNVLAWHDKDGNTRPFTSLDDPEASEQPTNNKTP